MKSVRGKMLVTILAPALALLVLVGLIVYVQVDRVLLDLVHNATQRLANESAEVTSEWIGGIIKEVRLFAERVVVRNALKTGDWKDLIETDLKQRLAARPYLEMLFIAYPDGSAPNTAGSVANVADRDYFIKIMKQGADLVVSDVLVSQATNEPVFVVAAAVKEGGETIGVFGATVLVETILQALQKACLTEGTIAWVCDSTGTIVVDTAGRYSMKLNIREASKVGLADLEKVSSKILAGESGYSTVKAPNGSRYLLFYAPIGTVMGWAFGIMVPERELKRDEQRLLTTVLIMFVLLGVSTAVVITFVSASISRPIKALASKALEFGRGDLTVRFEAKGKDEVARMAQALSQMADALRESFRVISKSSVEVSDSAQNLASVSQQMSASAEEIASQMEEINRSVQNASASIEEVTSGVEEVAASAQNVSRAAQHLAEASSQVNEAVKEGEGVVKNIVGMIKTSKERVEQTARVVSNLSDQAKSIGQILQTINSIAEQTNLLALNAAIEAARAGEAGRGFAVVADEIRKLAEESKRATDQIGRILGQISQGVAEADASAKEVVGVVEEIAEQGKQVSSLFKKIAEQISNMNGQIEGLAASAQEQSAAAEEMSSAMDNAARSITTIAQQVEEMAKAVKEQASAAQNVSSLAEELSSIAENLVEQVRKFRL